MLIDLAVGTCIEPEALDRHPGPDPSTMVAESPGPSPRRNHRDLHDGHADRAGRYDSFSTTTPPSAAHGQALR